MITCHLFIYVAPCATRGNLNEKSKSSSNVTSAKRRGNAVFTPLYTPAGRSDDDQLSPLAQPTANQTHFILAYLTCRLRFTVKFAVLEFTLPLSALTWRVVNCIVCKSI